MKMRLFIILSLLVNICLGQTIKAPEPKMPPFGDVIYFECAVTDSMRASGMQTHSISVKSINDILNNPWLRNTPAKTAIMLGVKLNPSLTDYQLSPVKVFYKSYSAFKISDGSDAILIALGITKSNINDFRYHVVMNDSAEVIPWSPIPKLDQRYGAAAPYGFIGRFKYPGKQILVEVVNTKDYRVRDGVIFDWRKSFRPVITAIKLSGEISKGRKHDTIEIVERKPPHDYAIKYDSATGTPAEIKFAYDSVSTIEIVLKDHEIVPYDTRVYEIEKGKKNQVSMPQPGSQPADLTINMAHFQPGKYEIDIQPRTGNGFIMEGQGIQIQVIILPQLVSGSNLMLELSVQRVVVCLVISLLFFVIYRRRINRKLIQSMQEKEMVSLRLRSIRSQLNPHFMFNALTSIQNLVNKNDMRGANHYLSRFADLTRKVLDTGGKELISLDDEIKIMDDYLQMEQLRFNFQYKIIIDEHINTANIEIPAMLLQPFAENAVKHGVADKREEGLVQLAVRQENKDLILSVTDNGLGFTRKQEESGASFGLKLSEERIRLLNDVYKDQPVELNMVSGDSGTTVTIKLTHWIS